MLFSLYIRNFFFKTPGKQRFDLNFFFNSNHCKSHYQGKTCRPICVTAVLGFCASIYECSFKSSIFLKYWERCAVSWALKKCTHSLLKTTAFLKYCSIATLSLVFRFAYRFLELWEFALPCFLSRVLL